MFRSLFVWVGKTMTGKYRECYNKLKWLDNLEIVEVRLYEYAYIGNRAFDFKKIYQTRYRSIISNPQRRGSE